MKTLVASFVFLGAVVSASANYSDGLEIHYTFADSPAQGVKDFSDHGRDGKIVGDVQPISIGPAGTAMDFRGGIIDMGSLDFLCASNKASWGAWIMPRRDHLGGVMGSTLSGDIGLLLNVGTGRNLNIGIDRNGPGIGTMVDGYTTYGEWQHVFATFDGGTARLYWNGKLLVSGSGTPVAKLKMSSSHGCVGDSAPGRHWNFDGLVSDVRIYGRVLSDAEISALVKTSAAAYRSPQALPAAALARGAKGAATTPSVSAAPATAIANAAKLEVTKVEMAEPPATLTRTPLPDVEKTSPLITTIGFSNDPKGDQDVTIFYAAETLFVRVTDVQMTGETATGTLTLRQVALDGQERSVDGDPIKTEMKRNDDGSFTASLSLNSFKPGIVEASVLFGSGPRSAIGRICSIRILPETSK